MKIGKPPYDIDINPVDVIIFIMILVVIFI